MDADSFIFHVKTEEDIAEDAETRSETSDFELDRSFPKGKN